MIMQWASVNGDLKMKLLVRICSTGSSGSGNCHSNSSVRL